MSDEHGYQRSGKKCREKFENLYKYYKKTKEGKAGRQDGKHYRFFRQLEALYGETSNPTFPNETNLVGTNFPYNINNNSIPNKITPNPNQEPFQTPRLCDSLSLSNSSDFDTSSSEDSGNNGITENDSIKKRKKRNWKAKIRDFIDGQMRRLMEKQEVWLEKMMKTIECKEQERISREEEWRKQESARIDREHTFWANERAWVQARDASLMEALHKITGKELRAEVRSNSIGIENGNGSEAMANVENGDRVINNYVLKMKEGGKKRKENVRGSSYFESSGSTMCNSQGGGGGAYCERGGEITGNEEGEGNSPPRDNSNVGGSGMHDSCFRFYMGDAENLWENYGLKLNKGENQ